jgi:hypothetical protein
MSLLSPGFNTGTYSVARPAAGTLDSAGDWVPAAGTTFSIDASVQPLSGRALKDLREGLRSEDVRWVYTNSELRALTAGAGPDVITIDGGHYRVSKVEHFRVISGHYRATVERLEVQ